MAGSADVLRFIVDKLNERPFDKGLSLVAFDEKTDEELLEVLDEVLAQLDTSVKVDPRDETPEQRGNRYWHTLHVCKYNLPTADAEGYKAALLEGDRGVVYPILHYILSKLPQLQKRAYLAKFLMKIEVPPEFMHDEGVQDVSMTYQQLQEEFKEVHKTVDRLRGNTLAPAELKKEIDQLEEERAQLNEKISNLKERTSTMRGFGELLEATSALRRAQEEETKLQDRMAEQQMARNTADKRYSEATRRLAETRANIKEDVSAEQLLEVAQREHAESMKLAEEQLPHTISQRNDTLNALRRQLMEPTKSEDDVRDLEDQVRRVEEEVESLRKRVAASNSASGDSKLAMYRSQSALVTKKLQQKEDALEEAMREKEELAREIEDKEAKMGEMTGPKFMKREEFKQYASQLRNKTNKFKKMKQELADIRAETVVAGRTQQILRGMDESLGAVMDKLEAERGVAGYSSTQEKLEDASERKAALDETKGKTLEEISKIVTDITQALKERKNKLAPQIKELRSVRQTYQELEQKYLQKKSQFESQAAGLDTERVKLEKEAQQHQEECLMEEGKFHELHHRMSILAVTEARIQDEMKFERGEGSLLRDFRTWRELYQQKVQQQEQLSKELRKQQKAIKENEGPNLEQRKMFRDLQRLLEVKVKVYNEEARREKAKDDGAMAATFDAVEIGGANVMRIDDS